MYNAKYHVGIDWTGTPSLNDSHLFGPGIVATKDIDLLENNIAALKGRFGISRQDELKGHILRPNIQQSVLETLVASNCEIEAYLIIKSSDIEDKWPKPAEVRHQTGVKSMMQILTKYPVQKLYCDDNIRGKDEFQRFKTDILRFNRTVNSLKLKISTYPSSKSTLIQCADVVAYVAARSLRPDGLESNLRNFWEKILKTSTASCRVFNNWKME